MPLPGRHPFPSAGAKIMAMPKSEELRVHFDKAQAFHADNAAHLFNLLDCIIQWIEKREGLIPGDRDTTVFGQLLDEGAEEVFKKPIFCRACGLRFLISFLESAEKSLYVDDVDTPKFCPNCGKKRA
jgi:hypothetical protein